MEKRTYQDRKEYLKAAVKKRRKKLKVMAVEHKGGKCEKCGYSKCLSALEFHHPDPTKKDFAISNKGHSISWNRIKAEIEKCIMLCANCHREEHERINSEVVQR